jgi:CHAT domain-containing protein
MKKIVFLLLWSFTLFAVDVARYEQNIHDDFQTYETKVLYEVNYQARELLDKASFIKEPYPLIKEAFDIHRKMQNGMFSILDIRAKKEYMREHKNYINTLFRSTVKPLHVKETFHRWINYKRTLFDRENMIFSNKKMSVKQDIIKRKRKENARAYQEKPLNLKLIEELKLDIEEFEKSLSSDLSQLSINSLISYHDISAILKPNELYLDFAKMENSYYLFTLDKKKNIGFKKLDAFAIENIIKEIQEDRKKIINKENFADIDKAKKSYGKLYDLLIEPLKLKDKTSLVISLDGLLNLIPFEALYHQQYLIEKYAIRYIPSAKELVKLHQNRELPSSEIVVFANPSFDSPIDKEKIRGAIFGTLTPTFGALEGTLVEAKKIKSFFPRLELFSNTIATEENLLKTISPKILHIATHGFFLDDESIINPMLKVGIVLSGANYSIKFFQGDGIVTALELSGLNLKGTELVVLSACETGVGKIEEAEGVAGLGKAFMSAGAKQIVMSLWSVSDTYTALLMGKFYENIKAGKSYSIALSDAKKWMINNNKSHPYYWSGFVGSGVD